MKRHYQAYFSEFWKIHEEKSDRKIVEWATSWLIIRTRLYAFGTWQLGDVKVIGNVIKCVPLKATWLEISNNHQHKKRTFLLT